MTPSADDAKFLLQFGMLGIFVWALWAGKIYLKREMDKEVERGDKLEASLYHALHNNERAIDNHDKLAERLPTKN
jgi:hypothetical protein